MWGSILVAQGKGPFTKRSRGPPDLPLCQYVLHSIQRPANSFRYILIETAPDSCDHLIDFLSTNQSTIPGHITGAFQYEVTGVTQRILYVLSMDTDRN